MRVSDILRTKSAAGVETVDPKEKVARVATVLSGKRIGTVVVSSDGKSPDGILSERDIVREIGRRGHGCLDETAADLMTVKVQTCGPNDSAEDVLKTMTEGRFRHMPVMDGGAMIGLISLGDVVKSQLRELEREKEALTDMIMGHA